MTIDKPETWKFPANCMKVGENMRNIQLYTCKGDYILETWGASTKHPDARFSFEEWREKEVPENIREFYDFDYAFIQWLAYVASKMRFEVTTRRILQLAGELYMDCEVLSCKPSEIIVLDNVPYNESAFSNGCIQYY